MLNNKKILITGGTGSLGHTLVERICSEYLPKKLIIFSRDEYKQKLMSEQYNLKGQYDCLRFFLGDVRDINRLNEVFRDVDIVIHAAALKQIPTLEYNPTEAIKTNVDGTMNVAESCINNDVEQAILISTDKAVNPINLYGATKLCAERIFLAANSFNKTKFGVVRYGNVLNSRGSVVESFLKLKEQGIKEFPITDERMTRFWITLDEAVSFIFRSLDSPNSHKQVRVPRIPSMKITDLARAIEPKCAFKEIGIRPGEKLHESLVTDGENALMVDGDLSYICYRYTSDKNDLWLTPEELRQKIGI